MCSEVCRTFSHREPSSCEAWERGFFEEEVIVMLRRINVRAMIASTMVAAMLLVALPGVALAEATAEATRAIDPQTIAPGETVRVTVEFESLLGHNEGFALVEGIPAGWVFESVDAAGADFVKVDGTIEWLWLTMEPGAAKTVVYTFTAPDDAAEGDYPIAGVVKTTGVDNPVLGDHTVTVKKQVTYTLTISVSPTGTGTTVPAVGTNAYAESEVVDLAAVPEAGYQFDHWSGAVETIANIDAAETTITMDGAYAITANFAKSCPGIDPREADYYLTHPGDVTTTITWGMATEILELSDLEESTHYEIEGDTLTIFSDAHLAHVLTGAGQEMVLTILFDVNGCDPVIFTITALEEMPEHKLTIGSTEGGSVTKPGEGTFTYEAGTVVVLEAEAQAGCKFVNWTGDVHTIADVDAAETTIVMEGEHSIGAEFEVVRPFPWWWVLIGIVLVGLLVYLLRRRRRKS